MANGDHENGNGKSASGAFWKLLAIACAILQPFFWYTIDSLNKKIDALKADIKAEAEGHNERTKGIVAAQVDITWLKEKMRTLDDDMKALADFTVKRGEP